MALINMKPVLEHALKNKYAVPAFNVCNIEFVETVINTAEEMNSPVIVAIHPVEIEYAGLKNITDLVKNSANNVKVPVVMHLDHGDSLETIINCLVHGFTSVMYDGSMLDYENNVKNMKEVVKVANAVGVNVEGELGAIGGEEGTGYVEKDMTSDQLTNTEQAVDFIERTGIDSLAVAIGTSHGLYTKKPKIDFERLKDIKSKTDIPLVLHGGSSLDDEVVKKTVEYGICKVNIASDLKVGYYAGIKDYIKNNPTDYEPRNIFTYAKRETVKVIREKIKMLGSLNKANCY